MTGRIASSALVFAACVAAGWVDPQAAAREAARLYATGEFTGAAERYNQALVDEPDSDLLHFNLGAAEYRRGEYERALAAYEAVRGSRPEEVAAAAYNAGNAFYRMGAVAEDAGDRDKALQHYAAAIAAYRRAMTADPSDVDAKHNHEVVERKIRELQQEQQRDQQQDQQQEQERRQPQQGDEQSGEAEQPDPQGPTQQEAGTGHDRQQEAADEQAGGETAPSPHPGDERAAGKQPHPDGAPARESGKPEPTERAPQSGVVSGDAGGEMTEQEAQALLDAARDQEVRPAEVIRRAENTRVLDPERDW